ncbi:MAG: oligosaccharide flippase family protein [Bacteroidales bacterium]|nr:oligosaccharide flippase family protein [Bacteroidales bacterium]
MKIPLVNKVIRDEFSKNWLTLFSGSAMAQLVPILVMPLLTRIYPEEVFGIFFIYSSLVVVLSIISTLEYELAVVLPSDDREGARLAVLSFLTAFVVSLLLLVLIALFRHPAAHLLGHPGIAGWLWLVPLSSFLTGIFQTFMYWANRANRYRHISAGKISRSASAGAVQLGAGWLDFRSAGLIWGLIAGQAVSVVVMMGRSARGIMRHAGSTKLSELWQLAVKYRNLPLLNTLIDALNNLSNQLPVFMLSGFYGPALMSQYGLANRIITTPMGLVGQSAGQVFYKEAADRFNNRRELAGFVRQTYRRLFRTGIIPFALMALFAPWIFRVVFGPEWDIAGHYTRLLIPWLFIAFLNSPITYIVTVLSRQRQMVWYDALLLAVRALALYAGYHYYHDIIWSIIFYSATGLAFNIFLFFYFIRISGRAYGGKD